MSLGEFRVLAERKAGMFLGEQSPENKRRKTRNCYVRWPECWGRRIYGNCYRMYILWGQRGDYQQKVKSLNLREKC
jgi:hypothetical protein